MMCRRLCGELSSGQLPANDRRKKSPTGSAPWVLPNHRAKPVLVRKMEQVSETDENHEMHDNKNYHIAMYASNDTSTP